MKTTTKTKTSYSKQTKEDLWAMIRVARLANVIAFTERAYLDAKFHDRGVKRRQFQQATFLLGGYIYEAVQLLNELKAKYTNAPFFSEFLVFLSKLRADCDILVEFSYSPAFHQDWRSSKTLEALDWRELDLCSLAASCLTEGYQPSDTYFPVTHQFDSDSIIESFKGNVPTDELNNFARYELHKLAERFLCGATEFIDGMSEK